MPLGGPPAGCEVEQVPEGLERADVPGLLSGLGRRVEELGTPEMPNRVALSVEHVQHRPLRPVVGLGEVVAVEPALGRGEESKVPPAALSREREHPCDRRLCDDDEVEMLARVFGGAVE